MLRECQEPFLHHRLKRKPPVSDPGMHDGTCVTHVPGTCRDLWPAVAGKTFPAFPAHAQTTILRIWQEAHCNIILKNCQSRRQTWTAAANTGITNIMLPLPLPLPMPWPLSPPPHQLIKPGNDIVHTLFSLLLYVFLFVFISFFHRPIYPHSIWIVTVLLGIYLFSCN